MLLVRSVFVNVKKGISELGCSLAQVHTTKLLQNMVEFRKIFNNNTIKYKCLPDKRQRMLYLDMNPSERIVTFQ